MPRALAPRPPVAAPPRRRRSPRLLATLACLVAPALALAPALAPMVGSPLAAQTPVDTLVVEGLRHNLGLAQQRLLVARGAAGVREARGALLPSLAVDARRTEAYGAVIDFGEFVNPAFGALNGVLGREQFPTDVSFRLPLAQETRLRLVQPLYQPAALAAHALARARRDLQGAALAAAAHRLAADIRLAYLDVARAARVVELWEVTLPRVAEQLRVNERLVANGRATPDAVLRARAERAEVEQARAEAAMRHAAAGRALNHLIGRPLDAPVPLVDEAALLPAALPTLDAALTAARRRDELRQAELGVGAARAGGRLARAPYLPALVAAVDYGTQGDRYRLAADRDFALATLSLQWTLFAGGQGAARREQAALDVAQARARRDEIARQVELEVRQAHAAAEFARVAIATAEARHASAEGSYRLVARRHGEGLATLVELLEARTSHTAAGINRILTAFDYLARRVDLARAAALDPIDPSLFAPTPAR